MPDKTVDEDLATDLETFIENDGTIYRQNTRPWIENLARKRYKGKFDKDLAVKGLVYLVEAGLKKYRTDYAFTARVNRATKEKVARELLENYDGEINDEVKKLAEKSKAPKVGKPKAPSGPLQETNPDKPGMKIRIREGAMGMPHDRFSPINWKWVAVMRLVAGRTLDVETEYLFDDQYNTAPVLPVLVDDWIAELVEKEPIYAGRQAELSDAKSSLTTTGLRVMDADVAAVINDARPGKMRCQWCGKTNAISETCPSCGKSEYLEPFGGPWFVNFIDDAGKKSLPEGFETEAEALKHARAVVGPSSAWKHAYVKHRHGPAREVTI